MMPDENSTQPNQMSSTDNDSNIASSVQSASNSVGVGGPVAQTIEPETAIEPESAPPAEFHPAVHTPEPASVGSFDGSQHEKTSPGMLVLQWLTYAFWGWTVLSLSWLTALVVGDLINRNDEDGYNPFGSMVAYALASSIVLFIIAIICDVFYARHENKHPVKSGPSTVIMVIHAVIFALFGIGSLVCAVFGVVQLLIGNPVGGAEGPMTLIITSGIIFGLYAVSLLRTLRPKFLPQASKIYWAIMTITTIVMVALAAIGPVVQARAGQEDLVIERGLPRISDAIAGHVESTKSLPTSLNALTGLEGDAKTLIDQNKVEYTPKEQVSVLDEGSQSSGFGTTVTTPRDPVFRYKLCVTYKAKKGDSYSSWRSSSSSSDDGDYETSPETYYHPAGRVCYELQTDYVF